MKDVSSAGQPSEVQGAIVSRPNPPPMSKLAISAAAVGLSLNIPMMSEKQVCATNNAVLGVSWMKPRHLRRAMLRTTGYTLDWIRRRRDAHGAACDAFRMHIAAFPSLDRFRIVESIAHMTSAAAPRAVPQAGTAQWSFLATTAPDSLAVAPAPTPVPIAAITTLAVRAVEVALAGMAASGSLAYARQCACLLINAEAPCVATMVASSPPVQLAAQELSEPTAEELPAEPTAEELPAARRMYGLFCNDPIWC